MSTWDWQVIDTGSASAEQNMAIDCGLLSSLASGQKQPVVHLYGWDKPSATYGHFTDPAKLLRKEALKNERLQLARRPTGGGIIFHLTDVAFSVLVPAGHPGYSVNVMENYAFVNRFVIEVVKLFINGREEPVLMPNEPALADTQTQHFCMAKPTKYDVMLGGRKVGGGAQRRTKHGFLHQGSISLALPDEALLSHVLLPGSSILDAINTHTCVLLDSPFTPKQLAEAQHKMRELLVHVITRQRF